jgi:hypothetical protein
VQKHAMRGTFLQPATTARRYVVLSAAMRVEEVCNNRVAVRQG